MASDSNLGADPLPMVDADEPVSHGVPEGLYWEMRFRQSEVENAHLRLEGVMSRIHAVNHLIDFDRYVYGWRDQACQLVRERPR